MKKIYASVMNRGPLSAKESCVLRWICEGYTRKEIAERIYRSPSTVASQIESIAQKLDCHSAAEIVATAVATGLVKIEVCKDHGLFRRLIICLLLINITSSHIDLRRGPRSPRPMRTNTRLSSSRLIRNQNRS